MLGLCHIVNIWLCQNGNSSADMKSDLLTLLLQRPAVLLQQLVAQIMQLFPLLRADLLHIHLASLLRHHRYAFFDA